MSGSISGARAAIQSHIDGLEISDPVGQVMRCYAEPPNNVAPRNYPYAYVVPPAPVVTRHPGSHKEITIDEFQIVVALSPIGTASGRTNLALRYEAWVSKLINAFDDAVTLDGNVDVMREQTFSTFGELDLEGGLAWGLMMTIRVILSETTTFSY